MLTDLDQLLTTQAKLDGKSLIGLSHAKADWTPWLSRLHEMSLADSTQNIFVALLELRDYAIPDFQRFILLRQLDPFIHHLSDVLEQHYLGYHYIDSERDHQIANLILEINAYHALIYFDIYQRQQQPAQSSRFSLFKRSNDQQNAQFHRESAFLALYALAALLYSIRWVDYAAVPDRYWHIVYQIYRTALERQEQDLPLSIDSDYNQEIYSINHVFQFIVLFYLLTNHPTKPYNLFALKKCVPYWLSFVYYGHEQNQYSAYKVNYASGLPPQPCGRDNEQNSTTLYLNTLELIVYMEGSLKESPLYYHEAEEQLLNLPIKQHVLTVLTLDPVRHYERQDAEGEVELVLGLSSAHYFLSQAKHFKESLQLDHDFSLQNHSQALSSSAQHNTGLTKQYQQQFLDQVSKYYQVHIIDKSISGYGLQWRQPLVKNLRNGELALIRETQGASQPWQAAIIRWTRSVADATVDMGLQLIAQHLTAVAVCKNTFAPTTSVYHPALYYLDKYGQHCLVLSGPQLFQENQNLILRFGRNEIKIFLSQTQMSTAHCMLFNFEILELSKMSSFETYVKEQRTLVEGSNVWDALK